SSCCASWVARLVTVAPTTTPPCSSLPTHQAKLGQATPLNAPKSLTVQTGAAATALPDASSCASPFAPFAEVTQIVGEPHQIPNDGAGTRVSVGGAATVGSHLTIRPPSPSTAAHRVAVGQASPHSGPGGDSAGTLVHGVAVAGAVVSRMFPAKSIAAHSETLGQATATSADWQVRPVPLQPGSRLASTWTPIHAPGPPA